MKWPNIVALACMLYGLHLAGCRSARGEAPGKDPWDRMAFLARLLNDASKGAGERLTEYCRRDRRCACDPKHRIVAVICRFDDLDLVHALYPTDIERGPHGARPYVKRWGRVVASPGVSALWEEGKPPPVCEEIRFVGHAERGRSAQFLLRVQGSRYKYYMYTFRIDPDGLGYDRLEALRSEDIDTLRVQKRWPQDWPRE